MRQKILIVDDEEDIIKLLGYNLGKAGFEVISAGDSPDAIEMAKSVLPDLVILDIMLPNMEGTEVLKVLKKDTLTEKIPVIMLTAKGEEIDRVIGLELGADDYIIKPFSTKELLLRVNVLLKKKDRVAVAKVIKAGLLTIDPERFQVIIDRTSLKLTAAEFKLIVELVSSNGRLLGREYLVKRISSVDTHATFRTVDTHIRRLRMKLGKYSGCIETVRGIGYRFREDGLKCDN
ncbi:MAG: response regulator transcription factor [Deltaproteobacteria bacterium]|nr:response regulator transcription factor [Deltaproteobacteria bacterium]